MISQKMCRLVEKSYNESYFKLAACLVQKNYLNIQNKFN